jgi:CDP-glycerol glycerophosphotransferase (TagB/SpsB family)
MNIHLLYIDPGTGSALFSIVIGLSAAVYFLFQTLYVRVKLFITGGKAKREAKNKFIIYAEDKRYWTLFKPIVEEFEEREAELLYLTSSKDDPVFDIDFQYIKAEYLGGGNKVFARLNFLSADIVLTTTPGLDVYQWKRSKNVKHYSHIIHSTSEVALYEIFGLDYFDSILATGHDHQKNVIRKIEKVRNLQKKRVVTVGCPYLDEYAKRVEQIPEEENHIFTILISPSWGKSALLSVYGEKLLEPLVKTDWMIIVRPHPQSFIVEREIIDQLREKYEKYPNLKWDFERENIYSIKKADVMISDYSGIIMDYMFLRKRPVIYVSQKIDFRTRDAFEIYSDQEEFWNFRKLKGTGIELKQEMFDDLPCLISKISADTDIETAIEEVKIEAWHYQGEAGKHVADFMIETVEGLV